MPSLPSLFPVLRGPDAQQSRVQDNVQGVLGPIASALQATPIMGAPAPAWILPELLNGYSNSALAGATSVSFNRDCLGYVHIKGGALSAAGTGILTQIFVLPMGCRPNSNRVFPASMGATMNSVVIADTGIVTGLLAVAAGASVYLEFSFLAEG